jgi:hypothetical protein
MLLRFHPLQERAFPLLHQTEKPKNNIMKTKSIIAIIAALAVTAGFTFAQSGDIGRCGQPRGTCGNQCDGSGYLNQGRGQGNGNGQGMRRGNRDGSGSGSGVQKRDRKRDGTGTGCKQGT